MKVNLNEAAGDSTIESLGISVERADQMWEHVVEVFKKFGIYESMAHARTTAILRDAVEVAQNNEEFLWVAYQTTKALVERMIN